MAIALKPGARPSARPRTEWRGILAVLALGVLLVGVALSGGLQRSGPAVAIEAPVAAGAGPDRPVFDNRGKWTGY